MAQLFTLPKSRPLTTAGRVMPASKLYFYLVGTTTLAAIYSDADCTVEHANPVVADANGEFAAIYLSGPRDVSLKTSASVAVWGPITVGMADGTSANILHYGAVGDGTTDDTTAIQAALDSGALSVYVPSGTYKFTALTMPTTSFFTLYGDGPSSILKQYGTGIAWASIGTATANYPEGFIRDLGFNGANGTGHTISTQYVGGETLQNLYFTDVPTSYSSIYVNGNPSASGNKYSHDVRLLGIQIYSTNAGASGIQLGAYSSDVAISDFIMNGNGVVLYCLDFVSGSQSCSVSNSHPYNAATNIMRGAGAALGMTFTNVAFDNVNTGLGDLVSITDWQNTLFNGCWFQANSAGRSCVTLTNTTSVTFSGCRFESSGSGLYAVKEAGTSDYTHVLNSTINGSISNFTNPVVKFLGANSVVKDFPGLTNLGQQFSFVGATAGTVAAGATVYLGPSGAQTAEENGSFPVPALQGIYVLRVQIACTAAPGVGQTFTYELRKNAVAMTAHSSSANPLVISGNATTSGSIIIALDASSTGFAALLTQLSIKLITSAGAAVTTHRYAINAIG